MTTWAVLRVTVQQERMTLASLLELGLTAYAPMHVTHARFAKRKATRTRPLIPGYLFVDLPDDASIDLARSIRGVREIMCRDGKPRFIPAEAVGALILAEAAHEFDETWEPPRQKGRRYTNHRFVAGAVVTVERGPFAGFVGTILKTKGKDRYNLLLEIFGRTNEIEIPDKDLGTQDVAHKRAA